MQHSMVICSDCAENPEPDSRSVSTNNLVPLNTESTSTGLMDLLLAVDETEGGNANTAASLESDAHTRADNEVCRWPC